MEQTIKIGDVLAFSGDNFISDCVNIATYGIPRWSLSHIGIVGEHHDRLLLFESTTLDEYPCEIKHVNFAGVQAHTVELAIRRYKGKVWHYPLYRELYNSEKRRLKEFLLKYIDVPYDSLGAFRTAGVALSWIESIFREQDLNSIFCSEYVAAAYSVMGLCPTSNVSRWNPNKLVRRLKKREILLRARRLK